MRFWFFIASTLIRLVAYQQNPAHRPSLRDLTKVHFERACVVEASACISFGECNRRCEAISFDIQRSKRMNGLSGCQAKSSPTDRTVAGCNRIDEALHCAACFAVQQDCIQIGRAVALTPSRKFSSVNSFDLE
jgi:hypothetical protein